MKNLLATLILALMSVMVSMPASATTGNNYNVKEGIPQNIIVKQTTRYNDGRTLIIYYKKQGNRCEIYSPCNEEDYSIDDIAEIASTNFEVVEATEGKLYKRTTVKQLMRIFMKALS
ncbi:MAG: hypothetical protein IKX36_02645 [Prevotella sp.]|nr:hypothetical protein [Prevotella sp.]